MVKEVNTAAPQSTREPVLMDGMREYDTQHADFDAEAFLNSWIVYVASLCIAMFLYCVVYAFYLWYLGSPPSRHC